MNKEVFDFVDPRDLRIGLYVSLDVGWMSHPFPAGSFKITTEKQIEILRSLGLSKVRFVPAKSDPLQPAGTTPSPATPGSAVEGNSEATADRSPQALTPPAADPATESLSECERRFGEASRLYRQVMSQVRTQPVTASQQCKALIAGLVDEVSVKGDIAVRLIKEGGERTAMHPVNVAVLSMLLGKAMGLQTEALTHLTLAAYLHDIGKVELPDRLHWETESLSGPELQLHRSHVANSVRLAREMGLPVEVVQTIHQHHELLDGTGYPARVKGEGMTVAARILAMVNYYDGLCNPGLGDSRLTPHEALARMFSQFKSRFDGSLLSVFIRMMGVYPPGSVVQLADERYALVVSSIRRGL